MLCYLNSIENITTFDFNATEDCFYKHLSALKREVEFISKHYELAMKRRTEENDQQRNKHEKKSKEKEKNRQLLEKKKKIVSPFKERLDTRKKPRDEKTLDSFTKYFDPFLIDQKKAKQKFPDTSNGMENLSKKRRATSEITSALTSSKVGDSFGLTTATKKQQTLNFASTGVIQKDHSRTKFQKQFEPEPHRKSSSSEKGKQPEEKSLRRAVTDGKLFNFRPIVKEPNLKPSLTSFEPPTGDIDATLDFTQLMKIKQERLSGQNLIASDVDLFPSDLESSRDSSVVFIEKEDDVIVVQDQTERLEERLLQDLERNFIEYQQSPEPVSLAPRRRQRMCGDCKGCIEIYDKYAEINGPTQAEETFLHCPKKCKGYLLRLQKSRPPPNFPNHPPKPVDPNNPTPDGFWDIPFTPVVHDN